MFEERDETDVELRFRGQQGAADHISIDELAGLLGITELNGKMDLLVEEKKKGGKKSR